MRSAAGAPGVAAAMAAACSGPALSTAALFSTDRTLADARPSERRRYSLDASSAPASSKASVSESASAPRVSTCAFLNLRKGITSLSTCLASAICDISGEAFTWASTSASAGKREPPGADGSYAERRMRRQTARHPSKRGATYRCSVSMPSAPFLPPLPAFLASCLRSDASRSVTYSRATARLGSTLPPLGQPALTAKPSRLSRRAHTCSAKCGVTGASMSACASMKRSASERCSPDGPHAARHRSRAFCIA
mmetsp:Transcript_2529/g.10083  ORF Transcript_2529/g.10083 Transcript_2529/m.10083 type:complete len:252 (+) Transcript_2529:544-1299(+)